MNSEANVMNQSDLVNLSLEQAADSLGDPTANVFALMYERFPDLQRFKADNSEWENYMIQEIITNLIQFSEDPQTAKVTLRDMSAHHDLIGVPNMIFKGMYQALFDVFSPVFSGPHREEMVAAWKHSIEGINACIVGIND